MEEIGVEPTFFEEDTDYGVVVDESALPSKESKTGKDEETEKTVTVTKPEKIGDGVNAYVTYLVIVKDTYDDARCVRRYSDFYWLRDLLREEFKTILIPPLPKKAIVNRFAPEFVEKRRKELERFMKRVVNHPQLGKSNHLNTFLTASETDIQSARARPVQTKTPEKPQQSSQGFFASITATINNITAPTVELTEIDPWFDTQKGYLDNLEIQLQVLQARSNANSKKKQEIMTAVTAFAHAASLVSGAETDQDEVLAGFWNKLSEIQFQISSLTEEMANGEIDFFEDEIKDYIRIVGAAKELLSNRSEALIRLQMAQADVAVKTEKSTKYQGSKNAAPLAADLQDAQDAETEAEHNFKNLSAEIQKELIKFNQQKSKDIRQALRELVKLNMNYELRVVDLWKDLLRGLEDSDDK